MRDNYPATCQRGSRSGPSAPSVFGTMGPSRPAPPLAPVKRPGLAWIGKAACVGWVRGGLSRSFAPLADFSSLHSSGSAARPDHPSWGPADQAAFGRLTSLTAGAAECSLYRGLLAPTREANLPPDSQASHSLPRSHTANRPSWAVATRRCSCAEAGSQLRQQPRRSEP